MTCSIWMREVAICCCTTPCSESFLPKAVRDSERATASSSARSAIPMSRMQWCTRPGPRRA